MRIGYKIAIRLYVFAVQFLGLFNEKAKKWSDGRKNWRPLLQREVAEWGNQPIFWLHAASLGEFEQGRPLIEAIRAQYPHWKIVLSFFSPSGYEIRKNYAFVDYVCYLPADTRRNARDFVEILQPRLAVFVKYEFWLNYLLALHQKDTPTLLVSGIFRPTQPFFQWYGTLWRQMLGAFTHFFVQNEASEQLLSQIGFRNVTIAGDTRIDRVLKIIQEAQPIPIAAQFKTSTEYPIMIVGSSWEADEKVYLPVFQKKEFQHFKTIIAPHSLSPASIQKLEQPIAQFSKSIRYSQADGVDVAPYSTLIIDNIGMLNQLYQYGHIAYIGGGFGKAIHNVLEPAAWGLPVIFGPKHKKFEEALQLVKLGGAFAIENQDDLERVLKYLADPGQYTRASAAVKAWLEANKGATTKILSFLTEILAQKAE
ncbi:MAG: 3-deoxy-D-manno-octulosonic acid transferase [Saprospiraceae bacterium]